MYGKSRNVLKIKTLTHTNRHYRVDMNDCLHEMETRSSSVDQSIGGIRLDKLEEAYMARPNNEQFSSTT